MGLLDGIKSVIEKSHEQLSHDSKKWTKRRYKFYLFFGEQKASELPWIMNKWNDDIEPLFNKILQNSPNFKDTGIRVLEYMEKNEKGYHAPAKFGRLRWDSKSHAKWLLQPDSGRVFHGFEGWTLIWTICERTNSAPDIFVSMQNEEGFARPFELQFNVFTVLAIAEDLKVDCTEEVIELSKRLNSRRTVVHDRKWSEGKYDSNGNWKFHNWIQDTWVNGLYKGQSLHKFGFDELVFEPYWKTIYKSA